MGGLRVSRTQGLKVSRSQGLKVSGSQGLRVSRSQGPKVPWSQGLKVSRSQGLKQSHKNPVSASALLTGKFLQIRKVFATCSLLAEEFPATLQYKISRSCAKCQDELDNLEMYLDNQD